MMRDSEYAARIRELTAQLNLAISVAQDAGLEVVVNVVDMRNVPHPPHDIITTTIKRTIE